MPRSGRLRNLIREYNESPRTDKISFIPPFLILALEIILLIHSILVNNVFVFGLTSILVVVSIIEIILVSSEIHTHYQRNNFDRILTIKLDDFIIQEKNRNVKRIVEEFIEQYPGYKKHRNEIYHISCQIMETHKEEAWEKALDDKLKSFIKRRKGKNVDEILESFLKKYPKYKKYRGEIYQKACQIMNGSKEK